MAKQFLHVHGLEKTNGFVLFYQDSLEQWEPYAWCHWLPVTPFQPFRSLAIAVEDGEQVRRMGVDNARWE